ncbi:MAG TPA: cupin [Cyanothece sp. UBA12306]|nr:cupin [Cyanothece sp. UBA12306]
MKLNADLSQRVIIDSNQLPWVDSPSPGVQRRMLERDGDEIARATTIVRFAPDSYFPSHSHGGGEEFLVLDGVFSDEHGDYGPGSYIRNPVGSKHTPHTKEGTTILVKLWQMHPEDQTYVKIDTNSTPWQPGTVIGQYIMPLHTFGDEKVELQSWQPGTFLEDWYLDGAEIFVIDGVLEDESGRYQWHTWLRDGSDGSHSFKTQNGCLFYLKTGHLA